MSFLLGDILFEDVEIKGVVRSNTITSLGGAQNIDVLAGIDLNCGVLGNVAEIEVSNISSKGLDIGTFANVVAFQSPLVVEYPSTGGRNRNLFLGYQSGTSASTNMFTGADDNISLGYQALNSLTTGDRNVAIGSYTAGILTTNTDCIAIGFRAASAASSCYESVLIGTYAGQNTTNGRDVFIGARAGRNAQATKETVAIGFYSGYDMNDADLSVAIGFGAARYATYCSDLVAIGDVAAYRARGSTGTIAIGIAAAEGISGVYQGSYMVALGRRSARWITGDDLIAIGRYSAEGFDNSSGSAATRCIAIGRDALRNVSNTSDNIAIGAYSMGEGTEVTGLENVAVGRRSLAGVTSGQRNVAVGTQAGYRITSGELNTFVGYRAEGFNVSVLSGDKNTTIGANARTTFGAQERISIGWEASAPADGDIQLGQRTDFSGRDAELHFRQQRIATEAWADATLKIASIDGSGDVLKGAQLGYLDDVDGNLNPSDGQILVYNSGTMVWEAVNSATISSNVFDTIFVDNIDSASGSGITFLDAATFNGTLTVDGATVLNGTLDVTGAVMLADDLVVAGNLTVNGNTTTINTETLVVEDNVIVVNSAPSGTRDAGVVACRYQPSPSDSLIGDVVQDTPTYSGTVQSGGSSGTNTIVIENIAAITTNDYFVDWYIRIISATTGGGQIRKITAYDAGTETITVESNWNTTITTTGGGGDAMYGLYPCKFVGWWFDEDQNKVVFGCTANALTSQITKHETVDLCINSLDLDGNLMVSTDTTISSSLNVGGDAVFDSALNVSGAACFASTVEVSGSIDTKTATTLALGPATATKVEIADSGVTTDIEGPLNIQQTIDTITGVIMNVGTSNATRVHIADTAVRTHIRGALEVQLIDTTTVGQTLQLGPAAAGRVEIADATIITDIEGPLDVAEAATLRSSLSVTGATELKNTLGVTGATTLDSTLTVGGVTTLSGETASAFLYLDSSNQIQSGAGTNGQLLIGSTGSDPVLATLTAGTGINITNGAGSITIESTATGGTDISANVLNDLSDVDTTAGSGLADDAVLQYNTGTSMWEPQTAVNFVGATTMASTLSVTGTTTLHGALDVTGAACFGSTVEVSGSVDTKTATTLSLGTSNSTSVSISQFNDVTTIQGSLRVTQTFDTAGAEPLRMGLNNATRVEIADTGIVTDIEGTLDVAEATILRSSLSVTGATELKNTLGVTGATTLGSTLTVGGVTTLSGETASAFLYLDSSNQIQSGAGTNGQLLIGSTGADPVLATLTAGTGIDITNGAGSITITNTGGAGGTDISANVLNDLSDVDTTAGSGLADDAVLQYNTGTSMWEPQTAVNFVGAITMGSTLSVTGTTTLHGALDVTGAACFASTMEVSGSIDTKTATTLQLGPATATRVEIADTGVITDIEGPLVVEGSIDTAAAGTLQLGPATANRVEIADTGVVTDVEGSLDVAEATTLRSTLSVTGATTFDGSLDVSGAVCFASTLEVSSSIDAKTATTLQLGPATATRVEIADTGVVTDVEGSLDVAEATTLRSTLSVTGMTTLNGDLDVSGAGVFATTLGATGAVSLGSTLSVTGMTTLNGDLDVSGAGVFATTLGATGAVSLGSTLSVAGVTTLSGETASAFLYLDSSNQIESAAGTNGQLLVGSTGSDPVLATLTGGEAIAVTNGAGSITLDLDINGLSSPAGGVDSASDYLVIYDASAGDHRKILVSAVGGASGDVEFTNIDMLCGDIANVQSIFVDQIIPSKTDHITFSGAGPTEVDAQTKFFTLTGSGTGSIVLKTLEGTNPTLTQGAYWFVDLDVVGSDGTDRFMEKQTLAVENPAGTTSVTLITTVSTYSTGTLATDTVTASGSGNDLVITVSTSGTGTEWGATLTVTQVLL